MNAATAVENLQSIEVNPLFVRHDLMIEMARLEMKIDDIREQPPCNDAEQEIVTLQQRLQKVSHVLDRIPA